MSPSTVPKRSRAQTDDLKRLIADEEIKIARAEDRLADLDIESYKLDVEHVQLVTGFAVDLLKDLSVALKVESRTSEIRSTWIDRKLAEHTEWTSDTDIEANGGPAYNTIQRYRSGAKSTLPPAMS